MRNFRQQLIDDLKVLILNQLRINRQIKQPQTNHDYSKFSNFKLSSNQSTTDQPRSDKPPEQSPLFE